MAVDKVCDGKDGEGGDECQRVWGVGSGVDGCFERGALWGGCGSAEVEVDGSMWSLDEQALDVVAVVVWGVLNGDLYAVYVGAVSVATVSLSKGDCCGLYAGGCFGIDGSYAGGGNGGSVRAFATGDGDWVGVGVGICVGDTGLGDNVGDAVGVWIGCGAGVGVSELRWW